MGRIGLMCHGSNLHRFGIGSNGLGSTLKNAKFNGDNILISTQIHSTQFDLSQFDLSYSTKRVDLILFDLFHSTHFMQSHCNIPSVSLPTRSSSIGLFQIPSRKISTDDNFFIRSTRAANELIRLKIISFDMSLTTLKHSLSKYLLARTYDFYNLNNSCSHFLNCFCSFCRA